MLAILRLLGIFIADLFKSRRQLEALVRGSGVAGDRLKNFIFKAQGGKLSGIFDGDERLISLMSAPWYSRDIYVPVP
jgi:hypothetical protein